MDVPAFGVIMYELVKGLKNYVSCNSILQFCEFLCKIGC